MAFKTAFVIKWRGGSLSGGKKVWFQKLFETQKSS